MKLIVALLLIGLTQSKQSKSSNQSRLLTVSTPKVQYNYSVDENLGENVIEFNMFYANGDQLISGFAPVDGSQTYPLFVWVTGTDMLYWTNDDKIYCNYMVERDFVAVSIAYANYRLFPLSCGEANTQWNGKARQLFDSTNPQSALSLLCDQSTNSYTSQIDCNKGIVLAGFSQGAQLVSLSGNFGFNDRIKGIYITGAGYQMNYITTITFDCLRYANTLIDQTKIRSCVGENDRYFGVNPVGVYQQQRIITNYCTEGNPDDVVYNCLQNDGSGFYIVKANEPLTGGGVHCYAYEEDDCHANDKSPIFDPYYWPQNVGPWSMAENMNWLIKKIDE